MPDKNRTIEMQKQIDRFEELLGDYTRSQYVERNSSLMDYVEGALLALLQKDTGQILSDRLYIALAGVIGDLATFEHSTAMAVSILGPRAGAGYARHMEDRKQRAISNSAKWLSCKTLTWWSRWFRKPKQEESFTGAKQLLSHLLEEYFPAQSSGNA